MAKINFSQLKEKAAEGNTFPRLDPGNYEFEVAEATFGVSNAGNPMITLQLQEVDSRIKVREFLTLTEKAAFNFFNFIENAGINPPEGEIDPESDEFDDFVHSLVGETVTAEVEDRKYKDKDGKEAVSNNIKGYVDASKVGKGKSRKKRTL